jgi:hypothetical protein
MSDEPQTCPWCGSIDVSLSSDGVARCWRCDMLSEIKAHDSQLCCVCGGKRQEFFEDDHDLPFCGSPACQVQIQYGLDRPVTPVPGPINITDGLSSGEFIAQVRGRDEGGEA